LFQVQYEKISVRPLDASNLEVEESAKNVGAFDFIMRFPNGLRKRLVKAEHTFSRPKTTDQPGPGNTGRPEVFVMDEATSSVDTLTESLIQKAWINCSRNAPAL
jgi:ATP-binding cassette subfamily B protein